MKISIYLFILITATGCNSNVKNSTSSKSVTNINKIERAPKHCLKLLKNINGVTHITVSEKPALERIYDVKTKYKGLGLLIEYRLNKDLHLYAYDKRPVKITDPSILSARSKIKFELAEASIGCFENS